MKNKSQIRVSLPGWRFALCTALLLSLKAHPQCNNNSAAYTSMYSQQSFYVPYTTNNPVITLKVTLHVFYYTDVNGMHGIWLPTNSGFNGTPGLQNCLSTITNDNRDRYSDPIIKSTGYTAPNWPPSALSDSRVRYEVTNIYYYNDQYLTNYDAMTNGLGAIQSHINSVDPARLEEGMPFIVKQGGSFFGFATQMNGAPAFVTTADANNVGGFQENFIHEMGHCFGLMHTYYGDDPFTPQPGWPYGPSPSPETPAPNGDLDCNHPDYLSDVFPINNPNTVVGVNLPPVSSCGSRYEFDYMGTNNIMSAVTIGVNFPYHSWISPLQMGRRIRNMHLTSNNIRKFAKDALSDHLHPWNITSNQTWDFDIQMYEDIVVKAGNTLTIKCKVAMATDGKITVEKGAKLVIDSGEVTGWCKSVPLGSNNGVPLWTGIEIDGNPAQNQLINNMTGYCPNQGIVEVKNQGKVTYALKGICTSRTTNAGAWISNTSGGIVIANTAQFTNNVFDIIFYKFQQSTIRSKIENSSFRTTAEIGKDVNGQPIAPKEHIKLFENWGLNIKGNLFEYAAGGAYNPGDYGSGIYTTDSHFTVDELNPSTKNNFINLREGIYIDNGNPIYTATIRNSVFTGNEFGTKVENCYYLAFYDNTVNVPLFGKGIYLYRSKYYNVRNNVFTGSDAYDYGNGVVTYDSKDGAHQVYRNRFSNLYKGILVLDDNGGHNYGVNGLKMNCNDFTPGAYNQFDVSMDYYSSMPVVMANQGSPVVTTASDLVRNLYNSAYYGPMLMNKWFVDPSNNQNIIHPNTPNWPENPNTPYVQVSPQVVVVPYNIAYNYQTHCPAWTSSGGGNNNNPGSMSQKLPVMNSYLTELRNNPVVNLFEVQATVASKLNLFLTDSLPSSQDSVIAILSANQGGMADADIQLPFTLLRNESYVSADQQIASLPVGKADWKGMLQKISSLKQNPNNIYGFFANPDNQAFMETYATTEDKDGQACAQGLRSFMGINHVFPVVYSMQRPGQVMGVADQSGERDALLYPNPTQNSLTIELPAKDYGALRLELTDVLGKTVISSDMPHPEKHMVSLSGLAVGVYLVKVTNESNEIIYQSKVVKQN